MPWLSVKGHNAITGERTFGNTNVAGAGWGKNLQNLIQMRLEGKEKSAKRVVEIQGERRLKREDMADCQHTSQFKKKEGQTVSCGSRDSEVISIRVISASGGEITQWRAGQCLTTSSLAAFTYFLWCKHSQHGGCKATSLWSLNPDWGEKLSELTSVVMAGGRVKNRDGQMALGFKVTDSLSCLQAG